MERKTLRSLLFNQSASEKTQRVSIDCALILFGQTQRDGVARVASVRLRSRAFVLSALQYQFPGLAFEQFSEQGMLTCLRNLEPMPRIDPSRAF